jgi:MlaD protein
MLLQESAESEERTLTIIGIGLVLCTVLVGLAFVFQPFNGKVHDRISVTIDTPYAAQGVKAGTPVVMHGVPVGAVTEIASLRGGGVRLAADLQKGPATGLTDTMKIDFRPVNYFGVTGVNIISHPGGQELRDGSQISTIPAGNFSLQTLLSRLGQVSSSIVSPKVVEVIDRATRYTDGVTPLIETLLIASNTVADVQSVSTAKLLRNSAGISVAFPSLTDAALDAADRFISSNPSFGGLSKDLYERYLAFFDESNNGLFGTAGRLEGSHIDDELPAIEVTKMLTDIVPPLLRPDDLAYTLVELRTRFERGFEGTPEQRALRVRIVLDSLPGVAAPLGITAARQ